MLMHAAHLGWGWHLGTAPFTPTHIQMPLDLLCELPGLLQIIGVHQFPLHDREGHVRAGGEVKVCDWRQGERRTGFVLHTLKLHHFHGGDRLGRETARESERETGRERAGLSGRSRCAQRTPSPASPSEAHIYSSCFQGHRATAAA